MKQKIADPTQARHIFGSYKTLDQALGIPHRRESITRLFNVKAADVTREVFFSQAVGDFKYFAYQWLQKRNLKYDQGDMAGRDILGRVFRTLYNAQKIPFVLHHSDFSFGYLDDHNRPCSFCLTRTTTLEENAWLVAIVRNANVSEDDTILHVITSLSTKLLPGLSSYPCHLPQEIKFLLPQCLGSDEVATFLAGVMSEKMEINHIDLTRSGYLIAGINDRRYYKDALIIKPQHVKDQEKNNQEDGHAIMKELLDDIRRVCPLNYKEHREIHKHTEQKTLSFFFSDPKNARLKAANSLMEFIHRASDDPVSTEEATLWQTHFPEIYDKYINTKFFDTLKALLPPWALEDLQKKEDLPALNRI